MAVDLQILHLGCLFLDFFSWEGCSLFLDLSFVSLKIDA